MRALNRTYAGEECFPVAPFRDAFLASGISVRELARRGGWSASYPSRLLGMRMDARRHPERQVITYHNAVKLCRALDIDPVDVGL